MPPLHQSEYERCDRVFALASPGAKYSPTPDDFGRGGVRAEWLLSFLLRIQIKAEAGESWLRWVLSTAKNQNRSWEKFLHVSVIVSKVSLPQKVLAWRP